MRYSMMVVCAKLQVRVSLKSSFGVDKEPESQAKHRGARAMHAVAAKEAVREVPAAGAWGGTPMGPFGGAQLP